MTASFSKAITTTLAVILVSFSINTASAQAELKSRVAVVSNESKTNIWVSDFPKETSIVITDNENNLLTIVTTNKFGAAFISLPQGINTEVIAKTMNGEVSVSNKAVVKKAKAEENVVMADRDDSNKA